MMNRSLRAGLVLVAARAARLPTIVVTDTRQAEAEVELRRALDAKRARASSGRPGRARTPSRAASSRAGSAPTAPARRCPTTRSSCSPTATSRAAAAATASARGTRHRRRER